jgi:hypothetical protein
MNYLKMNLTLQVAYPSDLIVLDELSENIVKQVQILKLDRIVFPDGRTKQILETGSRLKQKRRSNECKGQFKM